MGLFDKLRELISGFGFGRGAKQSAQSAAELLHREWAKLVDEELRSTRQRYKEAMRIDVGQGTIQMSLEDSLANLLEWGAEPWDLRRTLLRKAGSPWPKRGKNGQLYRPIFFPVSTGQIQSWGGWAAYRKKAIRLSPSVRRPSGTTWGGKLGPGLAEKLRPHHATDPLAGLYRMKQGPGGRSYYGTFRMISWGSKPWTHPGFTAKHLMLKAAKRVPGVLARVRR